MKSTHSNGRRSSSVKICDNAAYVSIPFEASCTKKSDFRRKNRKLKYRDPETGLHPFVRLIEDSGGVYRQAADLVDSVQVSMEQAIKEREARLHQHCSAPGRSGSLKSIDEFRADMRYDGDGTRIDLAYAIYAVSHGLSVEHVSAAIRTRDLSHKGSDKRQSEYVERTIKKALNAVERSPLAR